MDIIERIDVSIELLNKLKTDIQAVKTDKYLLEEGLSKLISSFTYLDIENIKPVDLDKVLISTVDFGKMTAHVHFVCDNQDIATIQELINFGQSNFKKFRNVGACTIAYIRITLKNQFGVDWN